MRDDDILRKGPYKGWSARDIYKYMYGSQYIKEVLNKKPECYSETDSLARYLRRQQQEQHSPEQKKIRHTKKKGDSRKFLLSNKKNIWPNPNFDSDDEDQDLEADAVCPKCHRLGPSHHSIYYRGACEYCIQPILRETTGYQLGCPSCKKLKSKRHEKSLQTSHMCLTCATDEYMLRFI